MHRPLLALALLATTLLAAPAVGHDFWPPRTPVAGPLRHVVDAWLTGGTRAMAVQAHHRQAQIDGDRVLVELHVLPQGRLDAWTDALLARWGALAAVRGWDVMDAWVPAGRVLELAQRLPNLQLARLPMRPRHRAGPTADPGIIVSGAATFQCTGIDGTGIHVALLDDEWYGFAAAQAQGEIGKTDSVPKASTNPDETHGTLCAEILFDMAPGIVVHPVTTSTLASLQAFVKTLPENKDLRVVSDSACWSTGYSFGDGTGKPCDAVHKAAQAGVAWINAAGNEGGGSFYRGTFTDSDGDGGHEFAPGEPRNSVPYQKGTTIHAELDWNDYPLSAIDLDLQVCLWKGKTCELLDQSSDVQDGNQPPVEVIDLDAPATGLYGFSIHAKGKVPTGLALRLFVIDAGDVLQFWQDAGSLCDPGHCKDTVAVGALPVAQYAEGPIADYSSQGPTEDGRVKPDIAAPSEVPTSLDENFNGTSAATPHMAAAVALYMQAASVDAPIAVQMLLADATPMGDGEPNNVYGFGRMQLSAKLAKAQCAPGDDGPCTTACGTAGTFKCADLCQTKTCVPPTESCNGVDDDCNGQTDETFTCAPGTTAACATTCGSTGTHDCTAGCAWKPCAVPAETCNGADDDCNGQTDEGFACIPGAVRACGSSGRSGKQTCGKTCGWDVCVIPATSGCAAGPSGNATVALVLCMALAGLLARRRRV